MPLFEKLDVIYDGHCAFCRRSVDMVRKWDVAGVYHFHDAWGPELVDAKFPVLRTVDLSEAMYVVTARGQVYQGFFAFRRMMWSSPLTWLTLPLFYAPGAKFVGRRLYAWIAKNRHRFGCRSDACGLPEGVTRIRRDQR